VRRITDEIWAIIGPVFDAPIAATGRPRADTRLVLDAILYRMRTGCQWSELPPHFPSKSTCHRWMQRWAEEHTFRAA
jgi:transposase